MEQIESMHKGLCQDNKQSSFWCIIARPGIFNPHLLQEYLVGPGHSSYMSYRHRCSIRGSTFIHTQPKQKAAYQNRACKQNCKTQRENEISAKTCRAVMQRSFFKDWKWAQEGFWALGKRIWAHEGEHLFIHLISFFSLKSWYKIWIYWDVTGLITPTEKSIQ